MLCIMGPAYVNNGKFVTVLLSEKRQKL